VTEAGDHLIVLTTWPEQDAARQAATRWVELGLAACVNVLPAMTSIYPWKGKIESGTEHLLVIKTTRNVLPRLQSAIREHHPYELPEIIALPIVAGLPEYLRWIDSCTR
jgi:periplasmic divalent cation tolerance protein